MSNKNWQNYFDKKAEVHGESVKSSDYFDDESFFTQRANILNWLGKLQGQTIMDAGCGVGAFSEPLTADNTVYGVDFSAKSLEFAAKRGLVTQVGDLGNLQFESGKFDLVLCIGVIQLIDDYRPILKELARVVKPGGTLLIQTLHKQSVQRKIVMMFEQNKKFDRMYGMDELSEVYKEMGFADIEFLKQYHPLKKVCADNSHTWSDVFCTSFAIKARKQG